MSLFRQALPLEGQWERTFDLIYATGMSLKDCDETQLKKLDWLHGRLVKQKRDEQKAYEEGNKKEPFKWRKQF